MSWIAAIKTGFSWLTGKSIAATATRTVLLGYAMRRLSESALKDNAPAGQQKDAGVKVQLAPASDNKLPILYGEGFLAGAITEAVMSNNRQTMTYVITICEKTGVKLSDDLASVFNIRDIYWNDQRLVFDADGRTVAYSIDREGNIDRSLDGRAVIYMYSGTTNLTVENYSPAAAAAPNTIVPDWDATYTMSDLIHAVVVVNYDRENGVTGIGNLVFHIENSMSQPGDCIYDYMTNTRYGAGIPPEEIYSE